MSARPLDDAPASTDADLIAAWAAGSAEAGAELYDRYFDSVVRFFRNKTPHYDDLVQRTFLGALEGRERLVDPNKFRSYLFSIAYNVMRNELRSKKSDAERCEFRESGIGGRGPHPFDVLAAHAEQRLMLGALRRLPFDDQVVLELYYFEGAKAREISELMQMPEGTVRTRLRAAKQRLEKQIRALSRDPALLQSTISGLEDWARGMRAQLGGQFGG